MSAMEKRTKIAWQGIGSDGGESMEKGQGRPH